jgi:hypothetical protein
MEVSIGLIAIKAVEILLAIVFVASGVFGTMEFIAFLYKGTIRRIRRM